MNSCVEALPTRVGDLTVSNTSHAAQRHPSEIIEPAHIKYGRMKEDRCTSNGTLTPESAPLIANGTLVGS